MELSIGAYSLPVLLTIALALIYMKVDVPSDWKPLVSIAVGVGLAILAAIYADIIWTAKIVIEYVLAGVFAGAAASGIYDVVHKNPQKVPLKITLKKKKIEDGGKE